MNIKFEKPPINEVVISTFFNPPIGGVAERTYWIILALCQKKLSENISKSSYWRDGFKVGVGDFSNA